MKEEVAVEQSLKRLKERNLKSKDKKEEYVE